LKKASHQNRRERRGKDVFSMCILVMRAEPKRSSQKEEYEKKKIEDVRDEVKTVTSKAGNIEGRKTRHPRASRNASTPSPVKGGEAISGLAEIYFFATFVNRSEELH